MTRLLLIDSRVSDIASIGESLTEDTEMVLFEYDTDTLESLQSKITKNYESVSIAQHNYFLPTCKLLDSMEESTILSVEIRDPQLQTWQSLVGFFTWLKVERGAQYIDLLACDLWGNPDWYYIIQTIRSTYNVWIRASINITGDGGDFILESDNVNLIGIYFTESISTYRYAFYNTQTAGSAPHFAWNPQINLPMNGGKVSVTNFVTLVGSMLNCSPGAAGFTYINPPGDISNVVNMWSNQNYDVATSYACLTASGQVITFGVNKNGGDSSANALALSSGVVKVVPSVQAYAAIKVDGTVVSWGSAADVPLTTTGNSTVVPTSAVDLTGCTEVVASGNTFAGLKANGTVIMWGFVGTWTLPTASDLSGVIKIKESLGYPSYSFIALRTDGHVVMWGPGGTARSSTAGLTSTSPIVDVYPNDYGFVIVRANGTVHKGLTNTITYTIPAGRTIMRVVPTSTTNFAIMFDNNSMYLTNTSTLITDVTEITVNDGPSYAYIQNGAVICGGDTRYGGSAVHATNGIQSGISVTSGVIKLASTWNSIAALKSNGTVAVWGIGSGGIYYSGVVQSMLTNVVDLIAARDGYFAITSANKIISWGSTSNKWTGTPSTTFQNNISYTAGKTVSLCTSLSSSVFVESSANVIVSPNPVTQYDRNTITYESNVQYRKAIKGRTYGFFYGSMQLSTFTPSEDTYTYTFPNTSIPVSGNVLCSIHDITSYTSNTFPVDASVNVSVIYNPVGPNPDPPSINGVIAGRSKLTILATPSNLTQGVASTNYKYSLDGTNYITYPNQTVVSSVTTSYSPALSVGGTTTMMRIFVHSGGQLLYVTDPVANRFYTSTFNGSTWSAFSTISSFTFQSASSIDMNSDCTRGVFAPSAAGSKCFYFTNAFSTPVQIQDNVVRTYKAAAISGDGKTMAVIADKVYYTKWNDASQNFGILSVANNDTATTNALAISSDGLMLAYLNGLAVYVATWNGSNYSEGTFISNLPTDSGSYGSNCIRFSTNDNILFASSIKASTAPSASHFIYYSCWNGSTFTTFTAYDSFAGANAFLWGIGLDSTNSIYSILYGKTPIYRFNTSITTTTVAKPTVLTLTSGITAGNPYTVSLKMTNAFGDSTAVTASSAVTPYDLPGAPILNSVTGGNGQITFTYSAGNANGSAITNYYYSINGGSTYVSMGSTSGSYTISSGLVNGTRYYLRLKAYNEAGLSTAYAIDASGVITCTVPGTPTITSAVGATGQITVNFTAPASNGGSVITGYNYSTDNGTSYTFRASTTSPIVITGLNNGTTYYVKLQAVNIAGSSTATAASTVALSNSVPNAPVITTVTPGNTRATVAFTAPHNGGLAITAYYYSYNSGTTYYSTGSTGTSFDVSGLTNGTSYTFLMKAQNSLGNSVASSASASASVTPYTIPGSPTITNVGVGSSQLTLSFNAPASNGGTAITDYQYSINGGSTYNSAGLTSPYVITGLTNGVEYTILLRAVNPAGNSSSVTSAPTTPFDVPDTPTISTIDASNAKLTVTYTPPLSNGGTPIIHYYYSSDNGVSYTLLDTSTNPFVISGLTNGTTYDVKMMATNIAGNSIATSATSAVPYHVPNAPTNISITASSQQAVVSYTAPSANGSAIINYYYSYDNENYIYLSASSNPFTITGLTNATTYQLTMLATNVAGNSAATSATSFTPFTIPNAPVISSYTLGNQQVDISFSIPDGNGNAVSNMQYSVNDGSYVSIGAVTSGSITGLTNGTSYTIKLRAVNDAGNSIDSSYITVIPRTVPSAPVITSGTPSNQSITVTFTASESNGGNAISSYQYSLNDGSLVACSLPSFTATALNNGTEYNVKVYAINAAGSSIASNTLSVTPRTVPDKPTITSVVASNLSAILSFVPPAWDGGNSIQNYKYSINDGSFVTIGSDSSPYTITDLSSGVTYSIKMRAVNDAGDSVSSDASSVVPYTVPDQPTITQIDPSNGALVVHYSSYNQGRAITNVFYSLNDGSFVSSDNSGANPLMIRGLTNVVSYSVKIKTANVAGNSSVSSAVSEIPCTVPDAPIYTSLTYAAQQAYIHFDQGESNGGRAVTSYTYSLVESSGNVEIMSGYIQTPSTLHFTGLDAYVQYALSIRSVNPAGSSAPLVVNMVGYDVPNPPVITSIVPGLNSATVYFTRGNNNGSAITKTQYSLNDGSYIDVSGNSFVVSNMTPDIPSVFTMTSDNEYGTSDPSIPVTTYAYTYPDPPTVLDVTPDDQSAIVRLIEGFNHSSAIITYKYSLNGGELVDNYSAEPLIYLNGLTNGTTYRIRVMAVNAAGSSTFSPISSPFIPYVTPSSPGSPIITNVVMRANSALLYFQNTENTGSAILGYKCSVLNGGPYTLVSGLTSPLEILKLTNGVEYSFKLIAFNNGGESEPSAQTFTGIPHDAPTTPVILNATSADESVILNVIASDPMGAQSLTYYYSLNGSSTYNEVSDVSNNRITIGGLTNGTSYDIKIKSTSIYGSSGVSNISYGNIPYKLPDAPVIQSVSILSESANVYFTASNGNGYPVLSYKYSLNDGPYIWVDGQSSPLNIYGLTNGVSYVIRLKATTVKGDSAASSPSASFITGKSPEPPSILYTVPSDETLAIYFQNGNAYGIPITSYKYSLDDGDTYETATDVSNTRIILSNLTNGVSYNVILKAVTDYGVSEPSVSNNGNIPYRLPDPPIIDSVSIDNQIAYVYFTDGSSNGYEIQSYQYKLSDSDSYKWATVTSSPIILAGLTNGQSYTVKLRSYNAKGVSNDSNLSDSFSPCTVPSAPTITNVTVANESLSVYFLDGNNNGRSITTYQYSLNGGVFEDISGVANPMVISGLVNGIDYTVAIKAVTSQGVSAASNTTVSYTPTSSPEPPSIVSVIPGNAKITVNFNDGDFNGSSLSGYKYSLNDGSFAWSTSLASPIVVEGLVNAASYSVRLITYTAYGASAITASSETVVPYLMQEPPVITRCVASSGSVMVYFIDGKNHGLTILGYKYSIDNGDTYSDRVDASDSAIAISNLNNGTTYRVLLKTVTSIGDSSASNLSDSFLPYTSPNSPSITSVTPYNQSIQVVFSQGSLGGTDLVGYKYKLNDETTEYWVSSSPFTVLGLTNDVSYTVMMKTIAKGGSSGFTDKSNPVVPYLSVQGAPTIDEIIPGNESAMVSFTPGTENGATVYYYEYSLDGTKYITCNVTNNEFEIENLTNDVSYSVVLRSFSNAGYSSASSASSSFIPYTVPNAPSITSVVAGNASVVVTIVDGSNNGRSVQGYYYSLNGGADQLATTSTSPITITDLSNNTSYVVSVKSYNIAGKSAASVITSSFVPFTNPDAPVITGVTVANHRATVSVVNVNTNGATILGYKYSLDNENWTSVTTSGNTFTIFGLTNGTSYNVYVKTVSNIGDSGVSSPSEAFIPRSVPSAPTIDSVVPGDRRITVNYTPGNNNGSEVTYYSYSIDNGQSFKVATQLSSPIIIYDLSNGSTYSVLLKATNIAGTSASSNASSSVVPYTFPDTPVISTIYPGLGCVYVNLNPVNANGSDITLYRFSLGNGFFDVSGLTTPLLIPNLVNKITYNITIIAINGAGESRVSNIVSVTVGAPQPAIITNVSPANKSLIVYFDVPVPNATISGIFYTYDGAPGYIKAGGATSPVTIPKLINGNSYRIRIRLVNANGMSIDSNIFDPVFAADVPSKLTYTVTPGIGEATVTLGPVITNGASVIKYAYSLNKDPTKYDISGMVSPLTIPNLTNNVPTTITMYALNSRGYSLPGGPSPAFTCVFLPPPAITKVSLIPGYERLTISFAAPVTKSNTPILTYFYSINGGDYIDASSTTLPLVVTGLQNNTNYTARVYSVNVAGSSPPSPVITVPVKYIYAVTSAPVIASVVPSNGAALVNYTPPAIINNSAVVKYMYTFNAGTTFTDVVGASGNSFTITGLSNNVSRSIQLTAVNALGNSPLSTAKTFIFVYTAPALPVVGTARVTGKNVSIPVTPPLANGSPIIEYSYKLNTGNYISAGLTLPIELTDLAVGTYSVVVTATNAVGTSPPSVAKTFKIL